MDQNGPTENEFWKRGRHMNAINLQQNDIEDGCDVVDEDVTLPTVLPVAFDLEIRVGRV